MPYLLAEANIAHMKAPLADPFMADLAARVGDLHGLAERSEGFLWRARDEDILAGELAAFGDVFSPFQADRLFLTMSVWRDVEALREFVYRTVHLDVIRLKRQWMHDLGRPSVALWWVPMGHRPTVTEAAERLRRLARDGPTPRAFNFGASFPAPVLTIERASPQAPESVALIAELDAEIQYRYPDLPAHGLTPVALSAPTHTFVVARLDGAPAGCGALRVIGPGAAEVKRMYVREADRGLGVARSILATLEDRARALGCGLVRLETGSAQPEAIALYRSAGYRDIPAFGEYIGIDVSRCFEKAV